MHIFLKILASFYIQGFLLFGVYIFNKRCGVFSLFFLFFNLMRCDVEDYKVGSFIIHEFSLIPLAIFGLLGRGSYTFLKKNISKVLPFIFPFHLFIATKFKLPWQFRLFTSGQGGA